MATITIDQSRWEVARGVDTPVVWYVQADGVDATMTGPTLSVYSGTTLLASPTVTAASGTLAASVTAASIAGASLTDYLTLSLEFAIDGATQRWQVNMLVVDVLDHPGCTIARLRADYLELATCITVAQLTGFITEAWRKVKIDLRIAGVHPGLTPTKDIIAELHKELTEARIARSLSTSMGRGVTWAERLQPHLDEYGRLLGSLKSVFKTSGSALFPAGETSPVLPMRAPVQLRSTDGYGGGRM